MSTLFWRFSEFTVIDKFALFLFDIVRLNFHWKFHLYLSVQNNILRGRCIYWFFTVVLVSEYPACGSDVVLESSAGVGT